MKIPAATLIVMLAAAVCAGCASTPLPPDPAPPEALARYKRIGVVSITAQALSRVYEGFLSVERERIDTSSWDIDAKYEQQIATELSSMGGFEAVQGTYSRSEFFRLGYENNSFRWEALESPIRSYCRDNRVDAILVAFAGYGNDFVAGTRQRIFGAGFISGFHLPPRAYMHLITFVGLFDCQSAKPVAARGLASLREGTPGEMLRASPLVLTRVEYARAPLEQLTDPQIGAIKNNLVELPRRSWAPTLRAIFGK